MRQLCQGDTAGEWQTRRPGSLRVPKPRGNSRKDPSPRRGWGARRPQPGFHPARTSAVAALPLRIGNSLREARPGPPAPPHRGGRLSAQTRRQERGREDVDKTCGLDVDTLTWTRSVGRGQLLLPRAGAASAQRRPCSDLPRGVGLRKYLSQSFLFVGATGSQSKSAPRPITCAFRVPQTCLLTPSARTLSVLLGGQKPAKT